MNEFKCTNPNPCSECPIKENLCDEMQESIYIDVWKIYTQGREDEKKERNGDQWQS